MAAISDSVRSHGHFRPTGRGRRLPAPVLWQWVLRFALPLLTLMGGTVLYWIWFDNIYGRHWCDTVGGIALAFTMLLVAIWSVGTWFSDAS
ncbi:MAG: hypothetical protein JSR91_04265 [Proteobacteria bacterium]|nr:hypothetical protein [Pseudomonadota bacterium]